MKRAILLSSILSMILLSLLMLSLRTAMAAKWHTSNGVTWTVGRVCRDGAILNAVTILGTVGKSFDFQSNIYSGTFEQYPVFVYQAAIDQSKIGPLIATMKLLKPPSNGIPFIYNMDDTIFVEVPDPSNFTTYAVASFYWPKALSAGRVIAIRNNDAYFITKVENCFVSPTATPKSPTLRFKATVGTSPSICSTQTSINLLPNQNAYACLVIENPGDVIFEQQTITRTLTSTGRPSTVSVSFPLTIPPGSLISVTQSIAQQAGLPFNLGPLSSGIYTFTWQAKGGAYTSISQASIKVSAPLAVFATESTPSPEAAHQIFLPLVSK